MNIKDLIEKKLGYIFSEDGIYEPDEITFTVELGARVEVGDIVFIEHPSKPNIPVFYQVTEVPLRRKARDYEEDLIRAGKPLIDESRNYPRARAKQIGYIEDPDKLMKGIATIDELQMLIEHIKPLSEVYVPKPEVVAKLLEPSAPNIAIGKVYPNWKHWLKLELPKLMRQGLLIVGGVGTGKTTTMLTILVRIIKEIKKHGGTPHILIVDKDGEYGAEELIEAAGSENYIKINIDEIGEIEYFDKEEYSRKLLSILGYYDRRPKAAKALDQAVKSLQEGILFLTPEFVEQKVLPLVSDHIVKSELRMKVSEWKRRIRNTATSSAPTYGIVDVVRMLKDKIVVHIDLSSTRDFDHVFRVLNNLLRSIYSEALSNEGFGCIIAIDEAHLFCPERGGISLASDNVTSALRDTLHLIATTGPRNGVTPFIATQRPSLISKTITTQMGQNIIAHRVEDVDLGRIEEIMGPIARRVRVLPRGWAIVKALATKIREPLIVKVEAEAYPASVGKTAYDRFMSQTSSISK